MFTGIVTAIGRVARVSNHGGLTLTIHAPYKGLKRGESVAVSGACLTVERVIKGGFTVHVVPTTVSRTLLGQYAPGRRVNLERAGVRNAHVRYGDLLAVPVTPGLGGAGGRSRQAAKLEASEHVVDALHAAVGERPDVAEG